MAYIVNTNIENQTNGYLLDAKSVKGSYIVTASTTTRNALPVATIMKGTLCFCQDDGKFYQYNGTDGTNTASNWKEASFGAGNTHEHLAGRGLTGSLGADNKYTYSANLKNTTGVGYEAIVEGSLSDNSRLYAVTTDSKGNLAVNVPWIEYEVATEDKKGLMSKDDKKNLNTLTDLLKNDDANTTVDTIREVLDVFKEYPEETTVVNALATKVDTTFSHSYTPAGTVSTPTITVDESSTDVNTINTLGVLPELIWEEVIASNVSTLSAGSGNASLTGSISESSLSLPNKTVSINFSHNHIPTSFTVEPVKVQSVKNWNSGSLPTTSSKTVLTGVTATASAPTFQGTKTTIEHS
jgi:hypothetical protein